MAQQYIDVKNQTMLWKLIQRSPQFVNNTVRINREQWFGSVIKLFYEQITVSKFSIEELKEWNQKTIAYMIADLKRIDTMYTTSSPPVQSSGVLANQTYTTQLNNDPIHETPQSRMSMYTNQFNVRQQEYTNMVKPPAPPIANFTEKVEEEVITNMDELLQQQLKQREYDVAQVRPPPPVISPETLPPKSSTIPELGNSKINIADISTIARQDNVVSVVQELMKQLVELREEVRTLAERVPAHTTSENLVKSHDIEEHGVGV